VVYIIFILFYQYYIREMAAQFSEITDCFNDIPKVAALYLNSPNVGMPVVCAANELYFLLYINRSSIRDYFFKHANSCL